MKINYFYAAVVASSMFLYGCNSNDLKGNMKEEHEKKCSPCEGGYVSAYTTEEVNKNLIELGGGWKSSKVFLETGEQVDCIRNKYIFENYIDPAAFAQKITPIAENLGHHPELTFSWGYLTVKLWTFSVKGLTKSDFILASKIEECYSMSYQKS